MIKNFINTKFNHAIGYEMVEDTADSIELSQTNKPYKAIEEKVKGFTYDQLSSIVDLMIDEDDWMCLPHSTDIVDMRRACINYVAKFDISNPLNANLAKKNVVDYLSEISKLDDLKEKLKK